MSQKMSRQKIETMLRNEQPEPMSPSVDERIRDAAEEHFSKKGVAMSVSQSEISHTAEWEAQSSRRRVWENIAAAVILVGAVALAIVISSMRKPDGKTTVPAKNDSSPSVTAEPIESGTDLVLLWAEDADSGHAADGVEEFRSAATDQGLLNDAYAQQAEYYNAAPKQLEELTGVSFFKRRDSNKTFDYLMYQGTVYEACPSTGDVGVCQIAVADLNRDGKPEVYYTSLMGSGMTTFAIHYFDTATRKTGELLRHQNIESYNESYVPERREPQVTFTRGYIGGIGLADSGPMSNWWGWITYNGDEPVCEASAETWSEKSLRRREQESLEQQDAADKGTE